MMIVRTQRELDAALASDEPGIVIDSAQGVWLELRSPGSSHVVARDSSHVVAWGSSHVVARGSSHVVARGSSHVVARGSSHVEARDSSHVEAWDSSHVEARDSSHVEARDSSHVEARGSSHVEARGSSHVEAGSYVAVHLHSGHAEVEGGVLIDLTTVDLADPAVWCDFHGVTVDDCQAVVYKAVRDDLTSQHGLRYPIGEQVSCDDWRDDAECGHGLHFSPSPAEARDYDRSATRYLACRIPLGDVRPLVDMGGAPKCKSPTAQVVREVDRQRKPVEAPESAEASS